MGQTLSDLADASKHIREGPDEEWPFRIAIFAREVDVAMGHPDLLREVADQLVVIAEQNGCDTVAGASPSGERLAGAVVALAENGLRLSSPQEPGQTVLLIDTILATGTQLLRAVGSAKRAGAQRTIGVVILANSEVVEKWGPEIADELVVLKSF